MNWKKLESLHDLNEAEEQSFEKTIAIFKHSTRCHISRMVLRQFENEYHSQDNVAPYFLDLLESRDVSNEVASRFEVTHQSPQLIIIKEGKAIYDASHDRIDADKLKQF